jgi:hypothetical protein
MFPNQRKGFCSGDVNASQRNVNPCISNIEKLAANKNNLIQENHDDKLQKRMYMKLCTERN